LGLLAVSVKLFRAEFKLGSSEVNGFVSLCLGESSSFFDIIFINGPVVDVPE
jgi:hypothetical protein